jgi:hypothetical protein
MALFIARLLRDRSTVVRHDTPVVELLLAFGSVGRATGEVHPVRVIPARRLDYTGAT